MEKIKFQIEIERVLDVLSKEIYDSPLALLRENVQNAYDAILMRDKYEKDGFNLENGIINVKISDQKLIISDNGIGMSESVLKDNYWKAGSTSKNTDLAKSAGVVGTFGIGGMANFGVCTEIIIETESIETNKRTISKVKRKELSIYEDCISIENIASTGNYGTKITIYLDKDIIISINDAKNYLNNYIKFIPVSIFINDNLISKGKLEENYLDNSASIKKLWKGHTNKDIKADVIIQCNEIGRITAIVKNISILNNKIEGIACFKQEIGPLWGLKNYFGLAPIPIKSIYTLGGIINLSTFSPTAGREALSKESIGISKNIIDLVEECASLTLSESELSNRNVAFMEYVLSINKIELANKIQIRIIPEQEMTLEMLKDQSNNRKFYYYDSTDESIIKQFGTPVTPLIIISRRYPRRKIETLYIEKYCEVEKIIDDPQIFNIYKLKDYDFSETSFIIQTKYILEEDYAVKNVEINYADISHNLPVFIIAPKNKKDNIKIYIHKNHSSIIPVLLSHKESFDVFIGFTKDYIRNYLYPQIRNWVPSSTREGAEALQKILQQKRELFEYGKEDIGLTSLISDYMAGKASFEDVIKKTKILKTLKSELITKTNIGTIANEIPDLINNPIQPPKIITNDKSSFNPEPPIFRTDIATKMKILIANKENPTLNNFEMLFSISERAFREYYSFFVVPHTTRIIWGGRRIIYILTHAFGTLSIYYDIELFEDTKELADGATFPTTTIITKNRIYLPIPNELKQFFELNGKDKRQFYVRCHVLF